MKMKLKVYRTNFYLLAFIIACMRYVICLEQEDKKFFDDNKKVTIFLTITKLILI